MARFWSFQCRGPGSIPGQGILSFFLPASVLTQVSLPAQIGTARRSNQSVLKEISPEYSSEGLMLKVKLQLSGHRWEELTQYKIPDAGKIEGKRRRE